MSEGYYSWKANRQRLVKEAEELGIPTDGSNNHLADAIRHARNPVVPALEARSEDKRLLECRRRDRAAAARLVARSSRGRWADPGGYQTPQDAYGDLYDEVPS